MCDIQSWLKEQIKKEEEKIKNSEPNKVINAIEIMARKSAFQETLNEIRIEQNRRWSIKEIQ